MKIGRQKAQEALSNMIGTAGPSRNQSKKNSYIVGILIITVILILWVYAMGKKAEDTVQVTMVNQNIYKNQVISESMLQPYNMIKGEYEKYAVADSNGQPSRKILLWSEHEMIIDSFAAYPIQADTYAEYRSFIKSRVNNSDNVLYSFPGKEIVPLDIGATELQTFKTFLQPGDRLNIEAIFSEKATIASDDGFGGVTRTQVDVLKTENVFTDIMIADLLNNSGESILDIYASYRDKSVYDQAALDVDQTFKDSTSPKSLLVALTPEEKARYYYYVSKTDVTFRVSLPQRVQ